MSQEKDPEQGGSGYYPNVPTSSPGVPPGAPGQGQPQPQPQSQQLPTLPPGIYPPILPDQTQDPAIYDTGKKKQPERTDGPGYPSPPAGYPQPPGAYPPQQVPGFGNSQQYYANAPPATGHPVVGIVVDQQTAEFDARERVGTTCGCMMLVLGMCFPFLWAVGSLLPLCYPGRRVRSVACANAVAAIVFIILAILLPSILVTRHY